MSVVVDAQDLAIAAGQSAEMAGTDGYAPFAEELSERIGPVGGGLDVDDAAGVVRVKGGDPVSRPPWITKPTPAGTATGEPLTMISRWAW